MISACGEVSKVLEDWCCVLEGWIREFDNVPNRVKER